MKFRISVSFVTLVLLASALVSCSGDSPTKGQAVSASQASTDLDKQLDRAASLPLGQRAMALSALQPLVQSGTPAQKLRFQQLAQASSGRAPSR